MVERFKKYPFYFFLTIIVVFGILLRLKGLLINPSMWHDECSLAWNIKFLYYSDFFGILNFSQMSPPFFMIATKVITTIFGFSDLSFRILPFLAGIGSIVTFYLLAEKTIKNKLAILFAVSLFAINQQLIDYSHEFKQYSSDVLFTIICLLFFLNLDIGRLNIKKTVFYGLVLAIIPWFSFTSVFIITGGIINLFLTNFKSNLNKKIILFILLMVSGLIYLKIYLINNYIGNSMVAEWQDCFLNLNPIFFLYILIENIKFLVYPITNALLLLIFLIWGVIIFFKEKSLFINIVAISFILLIIASWMHFYPFLGRLILFLCPIFLLLIIKPFSLIPSRKEFISLIIICAVIHIFNSQILKIQEFIPTKPYNYNSCTYINKEYAHEMMIYLAKHLKKDDIIFVSNAADTEFIYYSSFYNFENQIIQEHCDMLKHTDILNSLKKKKYYWFYITHEIPIPIVDWINRNTKIIKVFHHDFTVDYLIYAYVK